MRHPKLIRSLLIASMAFCSISYAELPSYFQLSVINKNLPLGVSVMCGEDNYFQVPANNMGTEQIASLYDDVNKGLSTICHFFSGTQSLGSVLIRLVLDPEKEGNIYSAYVAANYLDKRYGEVIETDYGISIYFGS